MILIPKNRVAEKKNQGQIKIYYVQFKNMARTITTPRRKTVKHKKYYVLKKRLQTPKLGRFGNTQFMARYERIGLRNLHR